MQENKKPETAEATGGAVNSSQNIQTVIIKNDTTKDKAIGGFGYRIYVLNGRDTSFKLFQPSIPAIQGQMGFKTFSDAEKISVMAAQKIREGNSFPTIEIKDLDSLGINWK